MFEHVRGLDPFTVPGTYISVSLSQAFKWEYLAVLMQLRGFVSWRLSRGYNDGISNTS